MEYDSALNNEEHDDAELEDAKVTLRIPKSLRAGINRVADDCYMSRACVMRTALIAYIRAYEVKRTGRLPSWDELAESVRSLP